MTKKEFFETLREMIEIANEIEKDIEYKGVWETNADFFNSRALSYHCNLLITEYENHKNKLPYGVLFDKK